MKRVLKAVQILALAGMALMAMTVGAAEADSVAAQLRVSVKTNFYSLSGDTTRELGQQMRSIGPIGPAGKKMCANTDWKLRWTYEYKSDSEGYYISSNTVFLDITFVLPKWIASKDTPVSTFNEWHRFMNALINHELGHSNIALVEARSLIKQLNEKKIFPDRKAMHEFVDTEGKKCLARMAKETSKYDQRTEHGLTQGAQLH